MASHPSQMHPNMQQPPQDIDPSVWVGQEYPPGVTYRELSLSFHSTSMANQIHYAAYFVYIALLAKEGCLRFNWTTGAFDLTQQQMLMTRNSAC